VVTYEIFQVITISTFFLYSYVYVVLNWRIGVMTENLDRQRVVDFAICSHCIVGKFIRIVSTTERNVLLTTRFGAPQPLLSAHQVDLISNSSLKLIFTCSRILVQPKTGVYRVLVNGWE
jgi:hypothetical protein